MTVCPYCGEQIPEDGAFCPFCGERLEPEETAVMSEIPEENDAPETSVPTEETEEQFPDEGKTIEIEPDRTENGGDGFKEKVEEDWKKKEEEAALEADERRKEEADEAADEAVTEEAAGEEAAGERARKAEEQARKWKKKENRARRRDPERRKRILRWIGGILTALGLLLLLGVALVLFQMHQQQREARLAQTGEELTAKEERPGIINYFTQADPEKVRREGEILYMPDELIAVSAQGQTYTDMERFFGERGIRVIGYVELTDTYQLRLPEGQSLAGLTRTAAELEAEEAVDCAVLNVLWEPACCTLPEDPWDDDADWEQMSPGTANWGAVAICAPESWERYQPGGVRAGLIDSAFDPAHEDLRYAQLRGNESYVRSREGEDPRFWQHGTEVAGVMGAVHDNGLGLSGIAEDCQVYACGSGTLCGQMDALSALAELAVQGVPAVQYSLGWQEPLLEAILQEDSPARRLYAEEPARAAGLGLERMLQKGYDFLLVLPAGNGLQGQGTDARFGSVFTAVSRESVLPHLLVVGAAELDEQGQVLQAPYSGRGQRVELLAPGTEIYTTLPEGRYGRRSGTSLAAAHVTAICAEAWSIYPGFSGGELKELLLRTARTQVPGGDAPMPDMTAVLEEASRRAGELPQRSEQERALDAYGALLHRGVTLQGREQGLSLPASHYVLLDMDSNGVQELLVYALDERGLSASFAIYSFRDGELVCLGNAWETCRFAFWSNMNLTLEVCEGRFVYAAAERNSVGYGETGERFWLRYNGKTLKSVSEDRRRSDSERRILIRDSDLTDEGILIGSARDSLWGRS